MVEMSGGHGSVEPLRFHHLAGQPGLRHGITRREGCGLAGNMSFSRGPDPGTVVATRRRWCTSIGVDPGSLVVARQVHGIEIERVTSAERGRGALEPVVLPSADGLITDQPDLALMTVSADCVSVVLYDPTRPAIGVAHAGWRGMVAGVIEAAVVAMVAAYGCRPADLLGGIGPSIGPCCYEVGPEVATAAQQRFGGTVLADGPRPDHPHFDLWAAARLALQHAGLAATRIEATGLCTRCRNDLFFSHRAEGPQRGLFATIIGLERP